MLARLPLASGLLACLLLADPLPVAASDHHADVIIGVPDVEIYAPPLSIQIGQPPLYRPYYYPPPPYYYPAPIYYYGPRYYSPPPYYHYHRDYYRDYYYRGHDHRRW